jgi:NADH:ubiquinone oxidoreductase subunit 2 (subunit N)
MAFFLLSLVGSPPFVGFLAKLYVFAAVIEQGRGVYATIAALNAAVAAFYYFKVLKVMIIDPGTRRSPRSSWRRVDQLRLAALALANVVPLFFWDWIEGWARAALVLYAGTLAVGGDSGMIAGGDGTRPGLARPSSPWSTSPRPGSGSRSPI